MLSKRCIVQHRAIRVPMIDIDHRAGGRDNRYLRILDLLGIGRCARSLQDAVQLYVGGLDQLSANQQSAVFSRCFRSRYRRGSTGLGRSSRRISIETAHFNAPTTIATNIERTLMLSLTVTHNSAKYLACLSTICDSRSTRGSGY